MVADVAAGEVEEAHAVGLGDAQRQRQVRHALVPDVRAREAVMCRIVEEVLVIVVGGLCGRIERRTRRTYLISSEVGEEGVDASGFPVDDPATVVAMCITSLVVVVVVGVVVVVWRREEEPFS